MRADKATNIANVAKELLENPLQTERQIAEWLWIWAWTVNRAKQELEQTGAKDDRIIGLTDKDFKLMKKIQKEKFSRLSEDPKWVNNNDLDKWENTAVKRYSLFRWSATDKEWGLKLPDITFQIINPNGNEEDSSEAI